MPDNLNMAFDDGSGIPGLGGDFDLNIDPAMVDVTSPSAQSFMEKNALTPMSEARAEEIGKEINAKERFTKLVKQKGPMLAMGGAAAVGVWWLTRRRSNPSSATPISPALLAVAVLGAAWWFTRTTAPAQAAVALNPTSPDALFPSSEGGIPTR